MKVITVSSYKNIPEHSVINVEKILKTKYKGIWGSMFGSYTISVPKKICIVVKNKKNCKHTFLLDGGPCSKCGKTVVDSLIEYISYKSINKTLEK